MSFKDNMIEAVERGWCDSEHAYDYVRDSLADQADATRDRAKEAAIVRSEIRAENSRQEIK